MQHIVKSSRFYLFSGLLLLGLVVFQGTAQAGDSADGIKLVRQGNSGQVIGVTSYSSHSDGVYIKGSNANSYNNSDDGIDIWD